MGAITHELRFTCQPGCTKCCDMDGKVYLSEEDVVKAAAYVGLEQAAFEAKYLVRTKQERRFRKPRNKQCPFLVDGGCSIHPAKPTQCRTFPFWPEIIKRRASWNATARNCPGIHKGDLIQIGTAIEIAEEQRTAYPELYKEFSW